MAYIPNYGYPQYGYQNQFSSNQYGQNQFTQQMPMNQISILPQQQFPTIFGKVVDGIDVVKSVDVPLGMTYIMPQANGESVFSKGWTPDGNTFVKEYKLIEQSSVKNDILPTIDWTEKFNNISDEIEALSKKIDDIKIPSIPKKKRIIEEVDEDDE